MQKLTIVFGVLLMAVGIWGYVDTGSAHPTALIPTWIGLVLVIAGGLAMAPARRMLWMHIAVTAGLVGFLFPAFRSARALVKAHTRHIEVAHPAAVHEELAMALVCLVFVLLCVRSFIAARRNRIA